MDDPLGVDVCETLEDLPAPRPRSLLVNLRSKMCITVEDIPQVGAAVFHLNVKPRDGDGFIKSLSRERGCDGRACHRRAGRVRYFRRGAATVTPCGRLVRGATIRSTVNQAHPATVVSSSLLHSLLDPSLIVSNHRIMFQAREGSHLAEYPRGGRGRHGTARPGRHSNLLDGVLATVQSVDDKNNASKRAAAEHADLLEVCRVPRRRERGFRENRTLRGIEDRL